MANITLSRSVHGAILSRRQFVKSGGVLVVGMAAAGDLLAAPRQTAAGAAVPANTPNPALWSSWLEIRADNTMAIHTGRVDFGQSTVTTAYRQIVADELDIALRTGVQHRSRHQQSAQRVGHRSVQRH